MISLQSKIGKEKNGPNICLALAVVSLDIPDTCKHDLAGKLESTSTETSISKSNYLMIQSMFVYRVGVGSER